MHTAPGSGRVRAAHSGGRGAEPIGGSRSLWCHWAWSSSLSGRPGLVRSQRHDPRTNRLL